MSTRVVTEFQKQAPSPTNGSAPASAPARRPGHVRHLIALALTGAVIAFLAFMYDPRNLFEESAIDDAPMLRSTATASVSSLSEDYSVDGIVSFRDTTTVTLIAIPTAGSGLGASSTSSDASIVTEILAAGTSIDSGDIVWRIGLEPTVVLVGPQPAYRALDRDTEGPDVEQLESSLVALGYDPDATVTVDEAFTANTEAMVERWQEAIGAEITGEVKLGDVIYIAGPSRVGAVAASVGDAVQDGSAMLDITALDRELTFTVPASDRDTLSVGAVVEADFPGGSTVGATVSEMIIDDAGGAVVGAVPDEPIDSSVDVVPVTVNWAIAFGDDLLTVPAGAIVRTDSGQYYVEVRDADGTERFVAVSVGRSSGGRVEISGDITVGETIIAP